MTLHHQIVIIGGGNAGLSVAARLLRAGQHDVAVIEPQTEHYYQPYWTLVGGGVANVADSRRPQASVMPKGVTWIKERAADVDPENQRVELTSGANVHYDFLVVAPGIQLDWDRVPGMAEAIKQDNVSSNYAYDLAPKTWDMIKGLRKGTAVFTAPTGAIKCAGAPQKIAYLAADYWRQQGVLADIRIVLVLPGAAMFGVEVFSKELERVAQKYGIEVRLNTEATAFGSASNRVTLTNNATGTTEEIEYDIMHTTPPQSAPDWIKNGPLADADDPGGYVEVDQYTMQHVRYPNIFALGDAGSTPNAKTGAAIRKQAPVVVKNLLAAMDAERLTGRYEGYGSCPLTTSRSTMLLAEFDYSGQHTPTIPLIDTSKERRDMWILKRHILPRMYWNLILKGRA